MFIYKVIIDNLLYFLNVGVYIMGKLRKEGREGEREEVKGRKEGEVREEGREKDRWKFLVC